MGRQDNLKVQSVVPALAMASRRRKQQSFYTFLLSHIVDPWEVL